MDLPDKISLPLGLGTSKLRSLGGGLSGRLAGRLLEEAFDLGIRFFDTAPIYGQGQVETAIGRLPSRIKDELIVCSKAGYRYGPGALVINALKPVLQPAANSVSILRTLIHKSRERIAKRESIRLEIRPDTIRTSLAGTLGRLRRDRLDLLLLHDPSAESLNDDNQAVLDALQREGLIGHWGVSTGDPAVAHRALELENLAVLQVPVDANWVDEAGDLFSKCHASGVRVIANRVLTFLGSKPSPTPSRGDTQRRIEQCFTFALSQRAVRMVLCGSTKAAHLRANVQSMQNVLQSA